jgi:hypothetical protein
LGRADIISYEDPFRDAAVSDGKRAASESRPVGILYPGIPTENQTPDPIDRESEIGITDAFPKRYGKATNILVISLA